MSVIVSTIADDDKKQAELRSTLESIIACNPFQILVSTPDKLLPAIRKLCESLDAPFITVLESDVFSKRHQLSLAFPHIRKDITVLVDDDVVWPQTVTPWLLAPFEDERIGGVGTNQRAQRLSSGSWAERCYNWLGAAYIERRCFETQATHVIDGGTSCMSGRTHAVRTKILKDPAFKDAFLHEMYRNIPLTNADDDNFITRWLAKHKWNTWVQGHPECEISTSLERNKKYLSQCHRWAKSNFRSNETTLRSGLWT